jgi:hypothetical protein
MLAPISGASSWCADRPAAFIATTSLFWFSAVKVISAPRRKEKGYAKERSWGKR